MSSGGDITFGPRGLRTFGSTITFRITITFRSTITFGSSITFGSTISFDRNGMIFGHIAKLYALISGSLRLSTRFWCVFLLMQFHFPAAAKIPFPIMHWPVYEALSSGKA
jgi:hypothetical protein